MSAYKEIDKEVDLYKEILEEGSSSRLRLFLHDRWEEALRKGIIEDKTIHIPFGPRPIGANWLPCFICKALESGKAQPDMACFVNSKEDGELVVKWFADHELQATLDFRPSEPTWIQVKIGACKGHLIYLKYLRLVVQSNGNVLTPSMLKYLKD